ncbi:hypothetical protein CF5_0010 [Staphylococcus phage CF5]|uniref:Phage protein n=1 Tax=Staphylococcus phage CF5 TaxID=3113739 RepID=A0AAX4J7Q2_9CAUD|nr:hypothetical protein CF5_0010 [Staphylococcus phage CF5]
MMNNIETIVKRIIDKFLDEINKGMDLNNQDEFNRFLDNNADLYELTDTQRYKVIKALHEIVDVLFNKEEN